MAKVDDTVRYLSAIEAVEDMRGGISTRNNIRSVNTEKEHHESR